ncbi:putative lipid II flippase FtsW, partial [bacterium]|nr:putative lipid II flippase FtsW [bacterium]
PNYLIIFVTALLLLLGMLILLSASSVISYQKFKSPYYMFWHQFIFGFLPGIIAFYVCSKIDFKVWQKLAFLMLLISLGLLIVVFIPGVGANYGKAQSWINIAGISIQPSEIVKLTFLIYLASWLNSKGIRKIKDVHYGLMPFIILMAVITILMLLQPDLGTLSIIVIIALTSFFVGGGNIKHILAIISGAMLLFFIAIKMAPYRAARFIVFMNPNADPQGLGYHLNQALIAVGSGGIFGVGLGHSRQKYGYLPEVAGDSIFAVMAEELGFVFCLVYILLIFVLIYQGILIAKRSKSYYGRILAAGIVSWIGFQSFLNIGSMIGLLPMTGVPLPFLSYGGTAMIMNLAAIGILVNISRYTRT